MTGKSQSSSLRLGRKKRSLLGLFSWIEATLSKGGQGATQAQANNSPGHLPKPTAVVFGVLYCESNTPPGLFGARLPSVQLFVRCHCLSTELRCPSGRFESASLATCNARSLCTNNLSDSSLERSVRTVDTGDRCLVSRIRELRKCTNRSNTFCTKVSRVLLSIS